MSSKRKNFFKLCRKLWTASAAATVAATALFISGNHFTDVAHAQQWNGNDTTITSSTTIDDDSVQAGSLTVNGSLTIQNGGSVTTTGNTVVGSAFPSDGELRVSGTGSSLTVGASTALPVADIAGEGSLTVESGATLELQSGTSLENASRLVLDGNISITGNATEVIIGDYASLNGTGSQPDTTLGYYNLPQTSGNGSVTVNGSTVLMGSSSGLLGGTGGMTITNASFGQIGLTGGQTIATAGDMSVTNSDFDFGDNFSLRSEGAMTLSDTGIDASSVTVRSGDDLKLLQGTEIIGNYGGGITSGGSLEMAGGSSINLSGGFGIVQTVGDLTLDGASEILQGNSSVIAAGEDLSLRNGSMISQGNDGDIFATTGNITISNSTVSQGLDGTIRTNENNATGSLVVNSGGRIEQAAGGTITITDSITLQGNAEVLQGDDAEIGTLTGSMSVSGGSAIVQGDNADIAIAEDLSLVDASVRQDDQGRINAGGEITVTRSTVDQGDASFIVASEGISIDSSEVTQGDESRIRSENGSLTVSGTSVVTQGDDSLLYGNTGMTIGANASVVQEDNGSLAVAINQDITIAGSVQQGLGGSIVTTGNGRLNLESGADINQGSQGVIRSESTQALTVSGARITQGTASVFRNEGDVTFTGGGTIFTQGANSTLAAGGTGNITVADGASVTLGSGSNLRTSGILEIDNAIVNLGGGTRITDDAGREDAATQILLGTNAQLIGDGLLRFNNDEIVLGDTTSLIYSSGTILAGNGTRIEGSGTIQANNGLIVEGGSVLRPGTDAQGSGTMTVVGPLTIRDGGILEIRLDENWNNDMLVVEDQSAENQNGSVMLGNAELRIDTTQEDFLNGNRTITFLSAESGIYGEFEFASVSDQKFLTVNQTITGEQGGYQEMSIEVARTDYFTRQTRDWGMSFNQRQVGVMLDATDLSGQWWDALTDLGNLQQPLFGAALDAISGRAKANSVTMYRETPWRSAMDQISWTPNGRVIMGNKNRHCPAYLGQEAGNCVPVSRKNYRNYCGNQREIWATPFYSDAKIRDDGNGGRHTIETTGFLAGINQRLTNTSTVGLVFGYALPELRQAGDTVEMDDFFVGLQFGTMITSKVEMKAMVLGGFQSYDMQRNLNPNLLPELNGPTRLTGDFDGNTVLASIEFARPFYLSHCAMLRPLVAFDTENVWQDSVSERGNSIYNLNFKKQRDDRTFVRTGLTGEFGGNNFTLTGKALYSYQLGGESYSGSEVAFRDGGMRDYVEIRGVDLDEHYVTVGAGGKFYLDPMKRRALAAGYDATFSEKATQQNIFVSLSYLF